MLNIYFVTFMFGLVSCGPKLQQLQLAIKETSLWWRMLVIRTNNKNIPVSVQWYESWLQNSTYTCSAQSVFLTCSTESVVYSTEPIFIMEINDDGDEGPTKLTKKTTTATPFMVEPQINHSKPRGQNNVGLIKSLRTFQPHLIKGAEPVTCKKKKPSELDFSSLEHTVSQLNAKQAES